MSSFVGIDVSKAKLDVVILQDAQASHFQVTNTPIGWSEIQHRLQEDPAIIQIGLDSHRTLWGGLCPLSDRLWLCPQLSQPQADP